MKKRIIFLPLLLVNFYSAQNTIPSTTVTGDLKVNGAIKVDNSIQFSDFYRIQYNPATETKPKVVSFLPTSGSAASSSMFKQPCNVFYPQIDPTNPVMVPFLLSNAFSDLIQVYGQTNGNSALSMGVMYDDGIISIETLPGLTANGRLRINPGCGNDVEICQGGGTTRIFNDANISGLVRVGNGSFNYPSASLSIKLNAGLTKGFLISNPTLSTANKTVFDVSDQGQTIIDIQNSGAPNGSILNLHVMGNSTNATDALEIFDGYTNKVNFKVKSNGFIYSREVNVQITNFPDYVFNCEYTLMSLEDLGNFIKVNKHLPNIPSAAEVEKNGVNIGELGKIQIQKIEELTLYIIELKKEIELLKIKID